MVEPLHSGPVGRDPLAVRVGRMTVAIRRTHARAVRVVPAA
jgi:ferrous iron transport protein A